MAVADLQAGLKVGRFTAHSQVEKYLARIAAIDKKGPAGNTARCAGAGQGQHRHPRPDAHHGGFAGGGRIHRAAGCVPRGAAEGGGGGHAARLCSGDRSPFIRCRGSTEWGSFFAI
jgi:hypothetical protein